MAGRGRDKTVAAAQLCRSIQRYSGQHIAARAAWLFDVALYRPGTSGKSVRVTYSFLDPPETPLCAARPTIASVPLRSRSAISIQPVPRLTAHAVMCWRLEPDHKEGPLLVPKRPIVFILILPLARAISPTFSTGGEEEPRLEAAGWKRCGARLLLPTGVRSMIHAPL